MRENLNTDQEHKTLLEENFLKHISYEYVNLLCDELDAQKEKWESIEVPESLDQRIRSYAKAEEKRKKHRHNNAATLKFLRRASIVVLAVVSINYFLMENVEAYRIHLLNSITYIKQQFTQIDYDTDDSPYTANIPDDFSGWYYMTYWPKGYSLSESTATKQFARLIFTNEEGSKIFLIESLNIASLQVDSENGEGTKMVINDQDALLVKKDGLQVLSWIQDGIACALQADDLSIKEMVKVAENIKKQE